MDFIFIKDTFINIFKKLSYAVSAEGVIGSFVIAIFLMTAEIHNLIGIAWLFVMADLITGIWASIHKGNGFRSRRFWVSIVAKTFIHTLMICMMYAFATIFKGIFPFAPYMTAAAVTGFICIYEFSSVTENVLVLFPDMLYLKKIKDLMSKLVNKQTEAIENQLDAATNKPEPVEETIQPIEAEEQNT